MSKTLRFVSFCIFFVMALGDGILVSRFSSIYGADDVVTVFGLIAVTCGALYGTILAICVWYQQSKARCL